MLSPLLPPHGPPSKKTKKRLAWLPHPSQRAVTSLGLKGPAAPGISLVRVRDWVTLLL